MRHSSGDFITGKTWPYEWQGRTSHGSRGEKHSLVGRWAGFSPLWTSGDIWVEEEVPLPRLIAALFSSCGCQAGHGTFLSLGFLVGIIPASQ